MNKYTVKLRKTTITTADVEVEAENEDRAEGVALEKVHAPRSEVDWILDDEEIDTDEVVCDEEEDLEGDDEDFEDGEQD